MQTNAKPTNKRCICPTCNEVFSTLSNFGSELETLAATLKHDICQAEKQ